MTRRARDLAIGAALLTAWGCSLLGWQRPLLAIDRWLHGQGAR